MVASRSAVGGVQLQADAAAQEGGREVAFAVAGQDDEREVPALDPAAGTATPPRVPSSPGLASPSGGLVGEPRQLGDVELALLEDVEQVVGQVDVALVDLVDEQDAGRSEGSRAVPSGPSRR